VTAEFYNCAVEVMRGAEAIDEYIALPQQEAFDIEYWLLEEAKLKRMPAEKELARQVVFARVMARSSRMIAKRVFEHLHALSLRFHLDRRTGAVSRDLERGISAISDLLDWTIYTILPTLLEIILVTVILAVKFDLTFPAITLGTVASADAQAIAAARLRDLSASIKGLLAKGDVKLDDYSRAHLVDLDARITKALDASVVMPRP
jgi:hypothetical protein